MIVTNYSFKDEVNNQYLLLVITILTIVFLSNFSGISFGIGVDDYGYLKDWDNIYPLYDYWFDNRKFTQSSLEITYRYLFAFFKMFTDDFEYFKIFNTLITLITLTFVYYKISPKYYFLMLCYTIVYLYMDFSVDQFRNALAGAFGVLSIYYIAEKKYRIGFIWFISASLIHNSMLWMILLFFAENKKLNTIMIVSLVVIALIPNKMTFVLDAIGFFDTSGILYEFHILRKFEGYTKSSLEFNNALYSLVMIKTIFVYLIATTTKINKAYLKAYLYAILLYHALIDFNTIGGRIIRDVFLLEPILLLYILNHKKIYILPILLIVLYITFNKNIMIIERILS
jgi:hypothetical protein